MHPSPPPISRVWRGVRPALLGLVLLTVIASPALASQRGVPAEPSQILRPLPLDIVDVVWQADTREEGLSFRLYREDGRGRLTLLSEMPARLGRHSYRLKDLPPHERQRYVLRLIDIRGRENALRTIELVGYHQIDPAAPWPPSFSSSESASPSLAAVLPRPSASRAFEVPPDVLAASRFAEPPDPPPDAAPRHFRRTSESFVISLTSQTSQKYLRSFT